MNVIARIVGIALILVLTACATAGAAPPAPTTMPTEPAAGEAPGQPERRRIPGIISFYDEPTQNVIAGSEKVRASEDFTINIITFGGGCEQAGEVEVENNGNVATLNVFDYTTAGPEVACTTELKFMPQSVTLRFTEPGTATIQVHGRRMGPETTGEGVPHVLEREVVVE